MKCHQCRLRTRIIDSRPTKLGTRRRHECPNRHRQTTFEVDARFLFRLAQDVLREPGFFSQNEKDLAVATHKFVERHEPPCKLKLVKAG